jgi:hypothetical protein
VLSSTQFLRIIDLNNIIKLQNNMVQCLVGFELIFPPSFFNIMTHILVHLFKEIDILGPIFLHNMFPFQRFMAILKKYVCNRARSEGSIARGYGTDDVIEFCVDSIDDLKPIGVPESRYEGRMRAKSTLEKKAYICMDSFSFKKAHYRVLQQSALVDPYIEEHKKILCSKFLEKSEGWITRRHMDSFTSWSRKHLMHNMDIPEQMAWLAKGPSWSILTFQGYEINGNTFYTRAQDKKSTNQNSGVHMDAIDNNGKKKTYYGYIEEI